MAFQKHNAHFLAWSLNGLARLTNVRRSSATKLDGTFFCNDRRKACMDSLVRSSEELSHMFRNVPTTLSAAVLVPFCINRGGEPAVLLTLRSRSLARHGGFISFPGGIADESDGSAMETALRETEEELGIAPANVDVWGSLHSLPSLGSTISVTPVVGFVKSKSLMDELTVNEDEVEKVFMPSLRSLCDPRDWEYTCWKYPGVPHHASPVFVLNGDEKIWGLTARILHLCMASILPELYCRSDPALNVTNGGSKL
ncbi:mitochondrial coenzyme A diphosphatase NUDT8-like [Dermacentor variabilis]|uniref:mitochondrial coenzyme A diphosphatase NUDT8-like n=1 Tax=Dermacentor variabilis TaxID=34621 RepID=UPI003F5C4015